mgnify:FL=1
MSLQTQVSYIGKGEVFIQKRGTAGAKMVPIGNCSALKFGIAEDKKELKDYTRTGGGLLDSVTTIKSVTASMSVSNLSPENLALATRGTTSAVASATVTDEAHADILLGSLIRLAKVPDITATVTVKKGATVIASAGNWEINGAGLWIAAAPADLLANDDITVSYTALAGDVVQALTTSNEEYTLIFSGLNEARSGKPVIVTVHRLKFSPAASLDWIADDFGQLEMSADLLADATVTGSGLSKYLKIEMASQSA